MKTYVILGLSTFGSYLAQYLAQRNFDIVVVDSNETRVEEVKSFVSKGIIGDAKDKEILKKLDLTDADGVIVSLGESIGDSLLVILYLKELGVKNIFVKVLTEDHAKIVNMIEDSEIIFPEQESAYKLAQRIDNPNVLDYIPLSDDYSIIDWSPSKSFIGKTLGELNLKSKHGIQVISIEETMPERVKLVPRAKHVIKESDVLVIIGKNEDIDELKKVE